MKKQNPIVGRFFVLLSSFLWGTALVYTQYVLDNGITSKDLVSMKMFFGFLTLALYIIFVDRSLFNVKLKGLIGFAVAGFFCHTLYNLFVFRAIEYTSIPVSVVLLYTAPIYVTFFSRIIFKERITYLKILALLLCIFGAYLSVTGGTISKNEISFIGVLYGLGSGLCYGLTTILNKTFSKDYSQITILVYTFGFAFLFSLLFSNPMALFSQSYKPLVYVFIIMLGIFSTALSYVFYVKGLILGVEPTTASIIATLEVPISVIGSVIVFGQKLSKIEIFGIILVFLSIVILNVKLNLKALKKQKINTHF